MTPRERLFAALDGQPTDHLPVWLLFPYHATGYYVDVRNNPKYKPIHELSKTHAITLNRRDLNAGPWFQPEVIEHIDSNNPARKSYSWQGRKLTSSKPNLPHQFLLSPDDLEALAAMPIQTDRDRIVAALDAQLSQYLREKDEFPTELGAMMLSLGEPISFLYHHADLEEFALWSITHNDLVAEVLDRLMQRCRITYRWCLERDLADVYFMVGSELAAPPMVSHETFQRWIVRYSKELTDLIHSYGKKVIQHFHGQIATLLPDFVDMGADGLHTIEAPPIGNCTFTQAYDVVGDAITLIGNIQYDDFRAFTPDQMANAVRDLIDETQGRRFILSPTAGPFDPNVSDRVIDNYRTFLETAWEYGQPSA